MMGFVGSATRRRQVHEAAQPQRFLYRMEAKRERYYTRRQFDVSHFL